MTHNSSAYNTLYNILYKGLVFNRLIADRKDYDSGEFSLYRTIKNEGMAA
jgi:hypothetical protein